MSERKEIDPTLFVKRNIGRASYIMGLDLNNAQIVEMAASLDFTLEGLNELVNFRPELLDAWPDNRDILSFVNWHKVQESQINTDLKKGKFGLLVYLPEFMFGDETQRETHPYFGVCLYRVEKNTYGNGSTDPEVWMTALPVAEIKYSSLKERKFSVSLNRPHWLPKKSGADFIRERQFRYLPNRPDIHFVLPQKQTGISTI